MASRKISNKDKEKHCTHTSKQTNEHIHEHYELSQFRMHNIPAHFIKLVEMGFKLKVSPYIFRILNNSTLWCLHCSRCNLVRIYGKTNGFKS